MAVLRTKLSDIVSIPEIQDYIDIVEKRKVRVCKDQIELIKHVKVCFKTQQIYVDTAQLHNYMQLEKYLPFKLFAWEKFVIALHLCTYWCTDGMPRWPDLFAMMGRGGGKDGFIAYESFCLASPYNPIREYDIDICALNEEQAMRPLNDLIGWLETPEHTSKLKRFFAWTKEKIVGRKFKSTIKGRTNNPSGKDGMRSGIVFFNELHQYVDYKNVNVFTTGLGKKQHPRRGYFTSNGDVREGPLDDILEDSEDILFRGADDNGLLPFICRLDDKKEVDDEKNWTKANPSLPYLPNLLAEIRKEYREWKKNPDRLPAFMSKRMGVPDGKTEIGVTDWDNIAVTNKEIPDLKHWTCTVGIDYMKVSDFASINLHFKDGDKRYDINHSWICSSSKDIPKIKAPWQTWVKNGLLTYVDDVEIHPSILCAYIQDMGKMYNISSVCVDNYRYTLLADALSKIGFTPDRGNLYLIKQTDILKIVPVIDSCFVNQYFNWGDNPVLRWATNNTKLIRYGRDVGADKGSFVYGKIEARSRKTDPFMALVMSFVHEDETRVYKPLKKRTVLVI